MLSVDDWRAREAEVRRCLAGLDVRRQPRWAEALSKYLGWLRAKQYEIEAEGRRGPS